MPHGLKYQNEFNSRSDNNGLQHTYFLQFWFKDYDGPASSILGGDTSVIQRCTVDDPLAPIKGQSLDITLINENDQLPITAFQSDDDDGVQVRLLEGTQVLFIGYLVQDDFYETKIDTTHTITLSANDSLGLLKGVILSDAAVRRKFPMAEFQTNGVDTTVYVYVADPAFYPQPGNVIEFLGVEYIIASAVSEVTVISSIGYNWTIGLTTSTGGIGATEDDIYLTGEINLMNRNSLLSIIAVCLGQTNLSLITNIYHSLYEYRQDNTISAFEQTIIDTQLFISGETYEDCYAVLTKIMTAFNCTLFQANGEWNIVHWYESIPEASWSYPNNAIPAFVYDETWAAVGTNTFVNNFNIGPANDTTWLAGLVEGALRGWKFSRKEFDYKQPKYLLKNSDFTEVGALIRQYVSGTDTISEYVATYWQNTYGSPAVERFIRVVYDNTLQRETDRYLVLRGDTFDSIRALPATSIECQDDDKMRFSCSFRTNVAGTPGSLSFAIQMADGTSTKYLKNTGATAGNNGISTWENTFGFSYVYDAGGNSNEWNTMDTEFMPGIPFDGLCTVFLPQFTDAPQNSSRECHFKNLVFEYVAYINDSTKITGQIHKQQRTTGPKLNNDVEIVIDDSPRNSIAGTLFLPTKTPDTAYGLQDRTLFWRYPADANGWRLGEKSTLDELRYHRKTTSKLEGSFVGIYQNSVPVSLLTMAIFDFYPNKNYTFGLLTIDYKKDQFSCTAYELYDLTDAALEAEYTFTYKYSTT